MIRSLWTSATGMQAQALKPGFTGSRRDSDRSRYPSVDRAQDFHPGHDGKYRQRARSGP